tara:strand:+ start:4243 stop:4431 length:189 start_codon:yes stop_codon:yes gene_type:complete
MRRSKFDFRNLTLETAEEEIYALQGTNFGHNMIGLILGEVAEKYGEDVANQLEIDTDAFGGC